MKKGLLIVVPAALVVFIPLLSTFFLGGAGQALVGHELPITLALAAYSLLMVEILLSARPKVFERAAGLQTLYAIHGTASLLVLFAAAAHIATEVVQPTDGVFPQLTAPLGFLGFLALIITTATGVLHLSVTFISRSPRLMQRKERPSSRERALWLHRFSLLATLLLLAHVLSIPAVRENVVFTILLCVYVGLAISYYGWMKLTHRRVTHVLERVAPVTEGVYQMEFGSLDGKQLPYRAGQYVFVWFKNSAIPRERHPFSIASAPIAGDKALTVIAKQLGDYTGKLHLLQVGDEAAIEGPYGHFFNLEAERGNNPLVLVAGGIGVTPLLSIAQEQLASDPGRPIHFVWGVATRKDAFYVERLQGWERDHPTFTFNLILSKEDHPDHAHGRIDSVFLERIALKPLYARAEFFICGPSEMMGAIKAILTEGGVEPSRIHIERFSF